MPAASILAVMAFGVLVAIAGHITKLRWLIVTGLVLLFAATGAMLVNGFIAYQGDSDPDPRQERNYREPAF